MNKEMKKSWKKKSENVIIIFVPPFVGCKLAGRLLHMLKIWLPSKQCCPIAVSGAGVFLF